MKGVIGDESVYRLPRWLPRRGLRWWCRNASRRCWSNRSTHSVAAPAAGGLRRVLCHEKCDIGESLNSERICCSTGSSEILCDANLSAPDARKLMSEILKSKRSKLTPEALGLLSVDRPSARSLSRREVADLASINFNHYQRIEQCTSVGVSTEVVERICNVLRMTDDERARVLALHRIWASPRRQTRSHG